MSILPNSAAHLLKLDSVRVHEKVMYPKYTVKETNGFLRPFIKKIFCCRCCCCCCCCCRDGPPVMIKPGRLYNNDNTMKEDQTFELGDFQVLWSSSKVSLTISHGNSIVWESLPEQNFVGGANLRLRIEESRGALNLVENVTKTYQNQSIEHIASVANTLTVSGRLSHRGQPGENDPHYTLVFCLCPERSTKALAFDLQVYGVRGSHAHEINQAQLIMGSKANEAIYGFGKQVSQINCKGFEVPIITEEGGIGRGDEIPCPLRVVGVTGDRFSSYAPSPHFQSNTGRSLFLTSTEPSAFDLRPATYLTIRVQASRMQGCLLAGKNPLDGIELLTEFVGRIPPPPTWINDGAIVGLQGGTKRVREIRQKIKAKGAPLAGVWIQDWVGKRKTIFGNQLWYNWTLNPKLYPEFQNLVSDLDKDGISTGLYINPFLVDAPEKELNGRRNLYKEAKERNFLVKRENGKIYTAQITFSAAVVDLSNEDAKKWLKEVIKDELLSTGAKFWMADFGEEAPFEGVYNSGDSGLTYHNQYPVDWVRLNREAIEESGKLEDAWFFSRCGFLNTPKYTTAMWLGDQNVNWDPNDGLPSAIDGLLSGGFSGFSISHSDIGGYTSITNKLIRRRRRFRRSRELLHRWMELNAFTPIFRSHEGNEPDKNAQIYDDDSLETFTRWSKVYVALKDYRVQLFEEATSKGYPVVRHPVMHYPSDKKVYDIKNTFMLGNILYISPVVEEGATKKDVYLPAGQWTHLWSGTDFTGGVTVEIDAPLGKPPVFYVKGAKMAVDFAETLRQEEMFNDIISQPKVMKASAY